MLVSRGFHVKSNEQGQRIALILPLEGNTGYNVTIHYSCGVRYQVSEVRAQQCGSIFSAGVEPAVNAPLKVLGRLLCIT